jgi:hypothetical protein
MQNVHFQGLLRKPAWTKTTLLDFFVFIYIPPIFLPSRNGSTRPTRVPGRVPLWAGPHAHVPQATRPRRADDLAEGAPLAVGRWRRRCAARASATDAGES